MKAELAACRATTDQRKPMFGEPLADWHEWFAWYPVRTWDMRWTWLQTVKRRAIQKHLYLDGPPDWWFEHERIER